MIDVEHSKISRLIHQDESLKSLKVPLSVSHPSSELSLSTVIENSISYAEALKNIPKSDDGVSLETNPVSGIPQASYSMRF